MVANSTEGPRIGRRFTLHTVLLKFVLPIQHEECSLFNQAKEIYKNLGVNLNLVFDASPFNSFFSS